MDSESAQIDGVFRLWTWAVQNKKQLTWATVILVIAGFGVYFYVSQKEAGEISAAEALSKLRPTMTASGGLTTVRSEAYMKIATEHPGTKAASRAALLAAGAMFTEGKYPEARSQFERFLRDYPESTFRTEALYGNAACLEALGKTAEAAAAFKAIVDRYPTDAVVSRSKLALARAYETEKQTDQAARIYEELVRAESFSSVGMIAQARLEDLRRSNPTVGMAPPPAANSAGTNMPSIVITNTSPANTNH